MISGIQNCSKFVNRPCFGKTVHSFGPPPPRFWFKDILVKKSEELSLKYSKIAYLILIRVFQLFRVAKNKQRI